MVGKEVIQRVGMTSRHQTLELNTHYRRVSVRTEREPPTYLPSSPSMKPNQKPRKITYCGINRTVFVEQANASILDVSIANQIPHLHECGGHARCTTCRVRILDGMQSVSAKNELETEISRERNWDPSIRLACQATISGEVSLQRLVWTSAEVSRLQLETVPEGSGEVRPLAILFCDMRNFSRLANEHPAFDLAHMLNRFFTILGDPILMNNGIIYQYVGDEIIGLFGTEGGDPEKHCMDAVRAALGMVYAVRRLNTMELKDFDTELNVGIGVHFGEAYVGHLGHPKHLQFSVIGDPVNVASRIQEQNKTLGTRFLVTDQVLATLPPGSLTIGFNSNVSLKGIEEPYVAHEVLGFSEPDINLELQSTLDLLLNDEDHFAEVFYQKVFDKAPQVRALFEKNMMSQGRMLTHMLGGIVYALSRPEYLHLGLDKLGRDHVRYGVKNEYYPVVRAALLETIEEELGEHYTPLARFAWENALDLVIKLMTTSKTLA